MAAVNNTMVTRRLAAIVIADVAGYSRLMERDDTGTFVRLRSIRDEVVDPAIVSHDGRIVKTAGDGFLAELPSALAALRASVQIQREMAKRNEGAAAEDRIDYRIGVNLGDVMAEKDDIAGDGVNVASRLESLAEPGGICVSGSVREQVHGQMPVTFIDIGEQQVKNIERPLRVYRVVVKSAVPAPRSGILRLAQPSPRKWLGVVVAVVSLMLVALASWWTSRPPRSVDAEASPPALSIAVVPLTVSAGSHDATVRGESITRDVATALSRSDIAIRVVPVQAAHMGSTTSTRQIARDANVRYVLEGEIQPRQDALEIRLALVDGASAAQVWSETTSVSTNRTSAEQDRALRTTMEHLRNRLFNVETRRAAAQAEGTGSAMDDVLRALALNQGAKSLDRVRHMEALFEEALRKDPDNVPALLGIRDVLDAQIDLDSHADRERLLRRMDEATTRAVNLNPAWPETWQARSDTLMYVGRWQAALEANDKATALDPDAAWLVNSRAWAMSMTGRPEQALGLVARAAAMDPPITGRGLRIACEAYLLLGRYEESADACEKALGRGLDEFDVAYFLAAAYGHLGATDRAAVEQAKILRAAPGFTIEALRAKKYSVHPDYVRMAETHWYTGLRKAGIPEK